MPEPTARGTIPPASTFDDQAPRYDARAGLPPAVGALVARSIAAHAGVGDGDLVVELGAGTGEIGMHLTRLPVRYIGLDSSLAMLEVFRTKVGGGSSSLIVADCNQTWPLPDGVAALVFASRVIHLLDPDHVTRQTLRIGRRPGFLILGRVLREPASIKERLRRRRQELLVQAGVTPRQGAAGTRRVVERCEAAGAASLGRRVVAEWSGETAPAQVIAGWETLSRMGSVSVDPVTRADILNELRSWARAEFGDPDRPWTFHERYAIDIIRLP